MNLKRIPKRILSILGCVGMIAMTGSAALASSHSDAPLIKQDPQANLTDVYAFVGNRGTTKVLNIVINVHPFCEPGDGVTYDKFADDALYSINIADPNTGAVLRTYNFRYSSTNSGYKNPNTTLSYGLGTAAGAIQDVNDAHQNYTQTYTLTRVDGGTTTTLGTNLLTPPPNVGVRTTPFYDDPNTGRAVSGATSRASLDRYTNETVFDLPTGETVFSGSRDDSFFSDIPGIFDLIDPRILGTSLGQAGGGVDGFKGFNVLTYAIQIPISDLPSIAYTAPFTGAATGVGVFASVSRPRVTLRSTTGDPISSGPFIQVNRLGNPLFNELLVAVKDKDNYNRDVPTSDVTKYKQYATNPEIAVLLNLIVFKSATPTTGPVVTTGRTDLAAVFIPDVLRVNTATDAVPLIGQGGNRLGFIGGDTTSGASSGWPNGRRFGDDVVDIALTAVVSGPSYATITVVGDNVPANDVAYNYTFPYAATPNAGTRNSKDSGINVMPPGPSAPPHPGTSSPAHTTISVEGMLNKQ